MAGIYIHIPFCKQACTYCNFHFSTSLKLRERVLEALLTELESRHSELNNSIVETIYLGGGTPSLLTITEIAEIFEVIYRWYSVDSSPEITLEANPDDLTDDKIEELYSSLINRLSIGTQSFFDKDLQYMNRVHNADEAYRSIAEARNIGFDNITIDLIYGTPTLSNDNWESNLLKVEELGVPHLSAYQLTVEPRTALAAFIQKGTAQPPEDIVAVEQFNLLMAWAAQNEFEHYEISNLCKPGYRSRHNSSYWQGKPYLGIGPAAHSFNGTKRSWNVANNSRYIKMISAHQSAIDGVEELNLSQQYNEYVMTGLRLSEGVSEIGVSRFGVKYLEHFTECIREYVEKQYVEEIQGSYRLTRDGKPFADRVASDCFYV